MSKLEKTTYLFLCLVCAAALYSIVRNEMLGQKRSSPDRIRELVGKPMPLPGVKWIGSHAHIIVAMTTHCQFCLASIPFYRKMEATRPVGSVVELIFVSPEPESVVHDFLSNNDVRFDQIMKVKLADLGVQGTPTLFLVDSSGIVRRAFRGKLSSSDEQLVLTMVRDGAIVMNLAPRGPARRAFQFDQALDSRPYVMAR